ncbi:hypothetical protein FOZ62_006327, partial [Perkinsus olseni]
PGHAAELDAAVKSMQRAMLAESTKATYRSRLRLWEELSHNMKMDPFPLDERRMERVVAALRDAGYKSAADYLATAIVFNEMLGHQLTPSQKAQARPMTLEVLRSLATAAAGISGRIRVACYALGSPHDIHVDHEGVSIYIKGSKTDQQQCGTARRLGRLESGDDSVELICPVRAAEFLLKVRSIQGGTASDRLCVNEAGEPWAQRYFREALKRDLSKAGIQEWRSYSLHSMRAGGCQWMIEAGIDRSKVKKFGRWSSDCIDRYARESYISDSRGYPNRVVSSKGQPMLPSHAAPTDVQGVGMRMTPAPRSELTPVKAKREEEVRESQAEGDTDGDWLRDEYLDEDDPWLR